MIELSDNQQYQDYFEAIANAHVGLDPTKPFLYGDLEVGMNEARHWATKKLWLDPPEIGQMLDQGADNLMMQWPCSLFVGGAAGSGKFADEDNYYRACLQIVRDIIGRIRRDYIAHEVVFDFSSIRLGRAEMMLGSTKIIGCRMEFSYKDPTTFPFDEAKWNDV